MQCRDRAESSTDHVSDHTANIGGERRQLRRLPLPGEMMETAAGKELGVGEER